MFLRNPIPLWNSSIWHFIAHADNFLENNKLRTTYLRLSAKIDCGKWERCLRDVEKKRYCVNKMQSATLFVRMQEHEK